MLADKQGLTFTCLVDKWNVCLIVITPCKKHDMYNYNSLPEVVQLPTADNMRIAISVCLKMFTNQTRHVMYLQRRCQLITTKGHKGNCFANSLMQHCWSPQARMSSTRVTVTRPEPDRCLSKRLSLWLWWAAAANERRPAPDFWRSYHCLWHTFTQ